MADLEKISRQVLRGKPIEDAIGKFDWKEFEQTIGDIFREHGFRVENNFRFRTKRRYENDLIAVRNDAVFCVDCKRWSNGRSKKWSIARAAQDQEKRTAELAKFMKSNPIARGILKVPDENFVPMIVTLHQEEVLKKGRTFVVPVKMLNSFVLEFHSL